MQLRDIMQQLQVQFDHVISTLKPSNDDVIAATVAEQQKHLENLKREMNNGALRTRQHREGRGREERDKKKQQSLLFSFPPCPAHFLPLLQATLVVWRMRWRLLLPPIMHSCKHSQTQVSKAPSPYCCSPVCVRFSFCPLSSSSCRSLSHLRCPFLHIPCHTDCLDSEKQQQYTRAADELDALLPAAVTAVKGVLTGGDTPENRENVENVVEK